MANTQNNTQKNSGNPIPGILVGLGVLLMIGNAGNQDYMDALEAENRSLGYEKNVIHQSDRESADKKMAVGAFLTAAGAIGLLRREQNAR